MEYSTELDKISSADALRLISAKALELRDLADQHHLDTLRYLLSTVAYEADTLLMIANEGK